jgi:hypothetical protein
MPSWGLAPALEPLLAPDELALLRDAAAGSDLILEFGCGGSTTDFLTRTHADVVSVESDPVWAEVVIAAIAPIHRTRLDLRYVDIGPVRKFGRPADRSRCDDWPAYWRDVWGSLGDDPDLVFVDGRFRVACALNAALRADTVIVMHDFHRREYKVVLDHLQVVGHAKSLVVMRRRSDFARAAVEAVVQAHAQDPH